MSGTAQLRGIPRLEQGGTVKERRRLVGDSYTAGDWQTHAFVTGPNGVGMTDFGTHGGETSQPPGINDGGQVVGESRLMRDDYVFISHSLGSRIVSDGLQRIAGILARQEKFFQEKGLAAANFEAGPKLVAALQTKHVPIFMLSNQLPLLQLGRKLPEVRGQEADYCEPEGHHYSQRMVSHASIVAFSDPNDLLSYGIPPGYQEKYIDSRLCPDITNISINVSPVIEVAGLSGVRPGSAHMGYDQDDRVIGLIAHGIGNPNTSPLVKERCELIRTIE